MISRNELIVLAMKCDLRISPKNADAFLAQVNQLIKMKRAPQYLALMGTAKQTNHLSVVLVPAQVIARKCLPPT